MTDPVLDAVPGDARDPVLTDLIARVAAAVDEAAPGRPTVDAVSRALRPFLGGELRLPADGADSAAAVGGRETVLHVDPGGRFSIVAMTWRPGERTALHDHVCWGVVGVHRGVEVETRYALRPDGDRLVPVGHVEARPGDVEGFLPPGDIHRVEAGDVEAGGDEVTVSVHVYGTDLHPGRTSVRRIYADPPAGCD